MGFFGKRTFPTITLSNTLSGEKDTFSSQKEGEVRMYSCGPTVYGPQHIGNLRAAVFADTVARTFLSGGYKVKRVINITDVGHMVGDGDTGEDKLAVGAKRENKTPQEVASMYAKQYLGDIRALNVDTKQIRFPRATDYIPDQIKMIRILEKRGHTYTLPDGVYFDTSTFPEYGKLGKRNKVEIQAGARVEMVEGKKHPEDFVLWRTAKPNDLQKWKSPWGAGNPGWSIECSAMIRALLGETIDVHTGGEDHISIHHNNEIAQSEGTTGKPLAHYWLHNAFLTVDGQKISKSLGNIYTLDDITAKGIHPLALRYLFLQAHYRSPLSFTWESLISAEAGLKSLWSIARGLAKEKPSAGGMPFSSHIFDDFSTSQALASLWDMLQNPSVSSRDKKRALIEAETLLGLSLTHPPEEPRALTRTELPQEVRKLADEREEARKNKDFSKADELRVHIEKSGYRVEDSASGPLFTKSAK